MGKRTPPASPDDGQHWTEPISSSLRKPGSDWSTIAPRDICRRTGDQKSLNAWRLSRTTGAGTCPLTMITLESTNIQVYRYCAHLDEDYEEYLKCEEPTIYINFFNWTWRTCWTELLQSCNEYWRQLSQYHMLFTQQSMSTDILQQMR